MEHFYLNMRENRERVYVQKQGKSDIKLVNPEEEKEQREEAGEAQLKIQQIDIISQMKVTGSESVKQMIDELQKP